MTLHPEHWRAGYRARLMSVFFDFQMAIYTRMDKLDESYQYGWDSADERAHAIERLRDEDPLEFTRFYGVCPVNWSMADAHATAEAYTAWRALDERRAEDLHLEDYNETRRMATRGMR